MVSLGEQQSGVETESPLIEILEGREGFLGVFKVRHNGAFRDVLGGYLKRFAPFQGLKLDISTALNDDRDDLNRFF